LLVKSDEKGLKKSNQEYAQGTQNSVCGVPNRNKGSVEIGFAFIFKTNKGQKQIRIE
jgi:hypothetical protein